MKKQIDDNFLADSIANLLMQGLTPSEIRNQLDVTTNQYLRVVYKHMKLNYVVSTKSELIKEIESELFICLDEYKNNPSALVSKRIDALSSRYQSLNYYN
jgi:hypothetical protein